MESHCKLAILGRKNPKLSYEEWHRYWSEEHPKLWLSVPIVKEKIIKYSQYHGNENDSKTLAGLGLPVASYDCIVTIVTRNFEDLMSVFNDPEYQRVVVPDEEYLFDRPNCNMLIGYDIDKMIDGKILPGVLPK
ncbi:EthD domain-containing protein [Xylogone sp. PMI_703]|nr:EthD domain-containing protein [Xylogone sp. PMI_703]